MTRAELTEWMLTMRATHDSRMLWRIFEEELPNCHD